MPSLEPEVDPRNQDLSGPSRDRWFSQPPDSQNLSDDSQSEGEMDGQFIQSQKEQSVSTF